MKKLITLFIIFSVGISFSQTSVSGGIYQNTTWTTAGSPYIVTGSIVVFPGKTLTIEPGCEVRFTADYSFNTVTRKKDVSTVLEIQIESRSKNLN